MYVVLKLNAPCSLVETAATSHNLKSEPVGFISMTQFLIGKIIPLLNVVT